MEETAVDMQGVDLTPADYGKKKKSNPTRQKESRKYQSVDLTPSAGREKKKSNPIRKKKYPWNLIRETAKEQDAAKIDHMYSKWEEIEEDLEKSERLFKTWSKSDDFARGCFRVIVAICLISSTIVSVVAGAGPWNWLSFVAAGLTAFGALQETLVKLCITDFTTKKRKKYHDQVRIRRLYLDKMFVSFLDSTSKNSDGGRKISMDELKQYLYLTYEMEEKLTESSMDNQESFLQPKVTKSGTPDVTQVQTNVDNQSENKEPSETDPLLADSS